MCRWKLSSKSQDSSLNAYDNDYYQVLNVVSDRPYIHYICYTFFFISPNAFSYCHRSSFIGRSTKYNQLHTHTLKWWWWWWWYAKANHNNSHTLDHVININANEANDKPHISCALFCTKNRAKFSFTASPFIPVVFFPLSLPFLH